MRTTTVSVAGAMDHAERTLVLDRDSPQISVRNGPISLGQLTPSPGYICDVVLALILVELQFFSYYVGTFAFQSWFGRWIGLNTLWTI